MARIRVKVTRTVRTAVVRRQINRPLTKHEWERLLREARRRALRGC